MSPRLHKHSLIVLSLQLLVLAPMANAAQSSPRLSLLNCAVSNGVQVRSLTGSDPIEVETNWFGIKRGFAAKISDPPTGGLTIIDLADGTSTYSIYLPLDRSLTGTPQTVRGEMHTIDSAPIVRFNFRKIGSVVCEVQIED